MKKMIPLTTIAVLLFVGSAIAKPAPNAGGFLGNNAVAEQQCNVNADCLGNAMMGNQGGFRGPSMTISTVAQAKEMSDDQRVSLKGYIIQSLGDKDYLFKDDTGTIQLEIDHKRWRGQIITPNDLVEIQGKIDKDWKSIEVDVKHLVKVTSEDK
ncbi:uncharacterized protein (TIGR00156 family) [Orbus hercynius]|uniref:Uncharacterized protein (TIGR00156 family) n=1 Tax=Orbus hercynius TaxID=593135 RepID=A0A495RBC9_9GAMM|nr:NirD/YgiW/YdeI family stress tolerance protein [Orbus hercynius]RKS84783.1 uncharacterized protein (TIGR00156 family) [Orbus hercynius]